MSWSWWRVTVLFVVAAVVMTWPLATVMRTEIAIDLGDPVFNCWVMLWTGGQILRFLHGDLHALADYWNGNIFYPAPLTIAYSEHLTPQMLQALPIFAATGNIILAYNLVLLLTFVMAGLGTFLLVREITGRPWAALLAGVAFAFAPYRMDQLSHIQVVSTQWMPLALYGFRRYFTTGRLRPLIGGAASVALQVLSCGYFLMFFVPFAGLYCLYEIVQRRLFASRRVWMQLAAAWLVAAVIVAPFITPYFRVRKVADIGVRPLHEVVGFSADVSAFFNAGIHARLWSDRLTSFPKPEGAGFPGVTISIFVLIAFIVTIAAVVRRRTPPWPLAGVAIVALIASVLLAFGPEIQWHGKTIATGPYAWLYHYVPGFDGVRVPARFLTLTTLFAAILAGLGAASLVDRWPRAGVAIVGIGIVCILTESWAVPLGSNQRLFMEHYDLAPRHLASASTLGPVYNAVRDLPDATLLAEFPFGAPPFDIQTVFYAGFHRKRVINGYSGFFPALFNKRMETIGWNPVATAAGAWATLMEAGVTHVVVHEKAYLGQKGPGVSNWLRASGAREIAANGTDHLFALK